MEQNQGVAMDSFSESVIFDFGISCVPSFVALLSSEPGLVFPEPVPIKTHLLGSSGLHPPLPMALWLASCLEAVGSNGQIPPYCEVIQVGPEKAEGYVSIDVTKLPTD